HRPRGCERVRRAVPAPRRRGPRALPAHPARSRGGGGRARGGVLGAVAAPRPLRPRARRALLVPDDPHAQPRARPAALPPAPRGRLAEHGRRRAARRPGGPHPVRRRAGRRAARRDRARAARAARGVAPRGRAQLLRGPVAPRDRRPARGPARHGEDAHPPGAALAAQGAARAARGEARRVTADESEDLLFLFAAGALEGDERDEVEAWLARADAAGREALARVEEEVAQLARLLPALAPPRDVAERLRRRIASEDRARGRAPSGGRGRMLLAAGLAALLAGGAGLFAGRRVAELEALPRIEALAAELAEALPRLQALEAELAEATADRDALDEELAVQEASHRALE